MRRTLRFRTPRILLASGAALALGGLGASTATAQAVQEDRPVTPEEVQRITETLTAKGYTGIHEIEVDDGRFEVDAHSPDGQNVDLELDLETLEVLHEEQD